MPGWSSSIILLLRNFPDFPSLSNWDRVAFMFSISTFLLLNWMSLTSYSSSSPLGKFFSCLPTDVLLKRRIFVGDFCMFSSNLTLFVLLIVSSRGVSFFSYCSSLKSSGAKCIFLNYLALSKVGFSLMQMASI